MDDSTTLPEETAVDPSPRRFRLGTFSSLRHLNFRYLWLGTLCMSGGQWIQQVTLGWLLYDLTGSSVLLGLLNGLRAVPFLVASPIAGVAADRMDRKKLILVTQYALIMTTVAMGLLVASGFLEVWHLFAFTLVTGVAWAFVDPVRQTLVPALVPREDLMNAVALNSAAFNLTKIIGPSLGGVLIVFSGAAGNFFVQSAGLSRRARVDLLDVHPADTDRSPPIVRHSQSQRGAGLCLVKPVGVCTDGHRVGPQDIRGALPDSDAGVSKRRPQSRSRRIGSFVGGAGRWARCWPGLCWRH